MAVRPVALNVAIACLFIVGSSLFGLGSVPGYVNVVGEAADSITYFVGSVFFTSASFAQLLQAQTPAMTEVAKESFVSQRELPEDEFFCDAFTYSVDPKK